MVYNSSMSELALNFELRQDPGKAVEYALKWVEDYRRETQGFYFYQDGLGLAPQWYGIVVLDLVAKRIISAQGYTGFNFNLAGLWLLTNRTPIKDHDDYALREIANVEKWAASGKLNLHRHTPQGTEVERFNPKEGLADWIADRGRARYGFLEILDDWYVSHTHNNRAAYRELQKHYELTPAEHEAWRTHIKEE